MRVIDRLRNGVELGIISLIPLNLDPQKSDAGRPKKESSLSLNLINEFRENPDQLFTAE